MMCIDCGKAEAQGTERSFYWCSKCNDRRFDRITRGLEDVLARLKEKAKPPEEVKP